MGETPIPFSRRHGYIGEEQEITIREDALPGLRWWVYLAARKQLHPNKIRTLLCETLMEAPNDDNWSEGNVAGECRGLLNGCEWFRVYDAIERIALFISENCRADSLAEFAEEINKHFREKGYGWKLDGLEIVSRGDEAFEALITGAVETLGAVEEHATAARELHHAIADLSRRPDPDLTGAIQHSMAALECVAREYCGDPQATLGKLLQRYPDMLPRPLDKGLEMTWGYASEMGRHVREGRVPGREEVELVVGLAATVSTYLARKRQLRDRG